MALRLFRQTAAIDLAETQAAADGIAALGGICMLALLGSAGVTLRDDGVAIDPRLPSGRDSLAFRIQWRRRSLKIRIGPGKRIVEATLQTGKAMDLFVDGKPRALGGSAMLPIPTTAILGEQRRSAASNAARGG